MAGEDSGERRLIDLEWRDNLSRDMRDVREIASRVEIYQQELTTSYAHLADANRRTEARMDRIADRVEEVAKEVGPLLRYGPELETVGKASRRSEDNWQWAMQMGKRAGAITAITSLAGLLLFLLAMALKHVP